MAADPAGGAFASANKTEFGTLGAAGVLSTTTDGRGIFLMFGRGRVVLSGTFSTTKVTLETRADEEDVSTGWHPANNYDPITMSPLKIHNPGVYRFNAGAKGFYRLSIAAGEYSDGPVTGRIESEV